MLNYIWFGMMMIAVVIGAITGNIDAVTEAAINMAKTAVEIAIGLIGIMALWLGTMKIAEESGLIRIISRALLPITIRLFPDVPSDHPAIGSIVLNMAANILGLGNAATPLGLKAMEELQELNPNKDTATNAMCTFLAINTSSVQLILPATVVAPLYYSLAAGGNPFLWPGSQKSQGLRILCRRCQGWIYHCGANHSLPGGYPSIHWYVSRFRCPGYALDPAVTCA